jgi:arsenite-transporting ATPase
LPVWKSNRSRKTDTDSGPASFHFFGGKGGVGKTTCAAAYAIGAARAGRRVLVVSTDPAHSLGDAFAIRLTSRMSSVRGAGRGLRATELDAAKAFQRWLGEHRRALADIIEHGTWLDRNDVDAMLQLAVPGIDELIGLVEIVRLASLSPGFDVVVVDTAPTGHTLRLLASPRSVRSLVGVLEALQRDHRIVREQLARVRGPEAADRLIADLEGEATDTRALLVDRTRTTVHWVTLAEELAVSETADGLHALDDLGLSVDEIIINRVTPRGPSCPLCDRRRGDEGTIIAAVRRLAGGRAVRLVDAESREPRGVAGLRRISLALVRPVPPAARPTRAAGRRPRTQVPKSPRPLEAGALRGTRLLFCGGKGGVGKTTVASAIALRLAREAPEERVLLLSTDPAHSLADVLAAPVSDAARPVPGAPPNLSVRELDPPAALAARRARLEASLQALAHALGSTGVDTMVNRGLTEVIDLAPPGIDELLGVLSVLEARSMYDVIIVDTAPTGHALRLLEMPAVARDWVHALLRVLLKYRKIVRPGPFAADLIEVSRQIRGLQDLLRNRDATHFITVARAAELPRRETARLLARLRRLQIPAPLVVVNALTLSSGPCPRCRAARLAERREMVRMDRLCHGPRCAIIQAPLAVPPPRGVAALEEWGRTWIA